MNLNNLKKIEVLNKRISIDELQSFYYEASDKDLQFLAAASHLSPA